MTRTLTGSIVMLVAAAAFASTAAAGGEPKNEAPFVRAASGAVATGGGEPKNEAPFTRAATSVTGTATRPAAHATPAPDWFERYAAAHPYGQNLTAATATVADVQGFRWRDALIGAAAALAIVALLASSLSVVLARRRDQLAQLLGT
jgi:hypothetical protein